MNLRDATKFVSKDNGKDLIVAEIGVRIGDHALGMLHLLDIKELYLIDPFSDYKEFLPADIKGTYHQTQEKQDKCYRQMFNNLQEYFSQVMFVTKTSEFAVELFLDEYFDFIYIDGLHEYRAVKFDINSWYKKVRLGGYIGGHDFGSTAWPGVELAVREISQERGKPIIHNPHNPDTDWLIQKT